jgi:hypothetical protein
MNKRKVEYWNSLRKRLNILVLVIVVLVAFLAYFFNEKIMMPSLFDIAGLFVAVNLPLLLLEMIDRTFDFKERGFLKKGFIYAMYSLMALIPVILFINF